MQVSLPMQPSSVAENPSDMGASDSFAGPGRTTTQNGNATPPRLVWRPPLVWYGNPLRLLYQHQGRISRATLVVR